MSADNEDSSAGRVLVTGASGFVGSSVAKALREKGYRVRIFIRKTSSRANVDPRDELAIGDIRDRASVAAALENVDKLVHVAADYRLWAPDPAEIFDTNVQGTRVVMEAALRAGVERIVHTSSTATLALTEGRASDESTPLDPGKAIGAYKTSKVLAERLVEEMIARAGLPATIVNPSTPIGPRDIKPTPTGRIIVEAASGRMPAFVDTGLNLVHVDDVAAGFVAALERGRIGEKYILGGDNVVLGQMLAEIAGIAGRRPPRVRLPIPLVFPFAYGAEVAARFTGRAPFASLDGLRMARTRMFFSDAKARRELGYATRPHAQALADAVAWFRKAGFVR